MLRSSLKLMWQWHRNVGLSRRECRRLNRMPRFVPGSIDLFGQTFRFVDACTFLGGVREIFMDQVYAFPSTAPAPRIIDCGANIGLSVLYFKRRFPNAQIRAVEADPNIAQVLRQNVLSYGLADVEVLNRAVWDEDTTVEFELEGGFSGRVAQDDTIQQKAKVDTIRLGGWLDGDIDLLKIDIEGAELRVMRDIGHKLGGVRHLFIEYHSVIGKPQQLSELLEILREAGFRYYIKEAYPLPNPFLQPPLVGDMDLQLNIYAVNEQAQRG